MSTRRRSGFTLLEVLAVVLITAMLLGATISFYLNLSRQATRASENTRDVRRAAALVDRIASDLEQTLLVKKPPEADPLSRPWLFLAEERYASGAERASDQIKFIRRDTPRASDGPASDVAMVAYTLKRSDTGPNFELRRWSISELPDRLDREFPRSDDPASLVVADDLSYFGLRFLNESGEWSSRWDSTQVAESSELPLAVEIAVSLAPPVAPESDPDFAVEPIVYKREVALPMRPIDLDALLNPKDDTQLAANGTTNPSSSQPGQNKTLGECVDITKLGMNMPGVSPSDLAALAAAVQNAPATALQPYAQILQQMPGVVKDGCM